MSDEELGILPLEGKYYGTLINTPWGELEVWENPGGRPSDRELASYGMTPEQWETADNETKFDITCDCHYETQADYELARSIAKAIKGYGELGEGWGEPYAHRDPGKGRPARTARNTRGER